MRRLQKRDAFLLGIFTFLAAAVPAAPSLSPTREGELELRTAEDARVDSYRVSLESDKERGLLVSPLEVRFSPGSERNYLNNLVTNTAAAKDVQVTNIAFVKTHKTASTTLAYLLFRYARRHGAKLAQFDGHNSAIPLREAAAQTAKGKGRVDIMHYHMSVFGQLDGTWHEAEQNYRRIMRDDAAVNFVTVMRKPRSHLLSYYYYFIQPNTQKSIEEFLMHPKSSDNKQRSKLFNPLSAEFGVTTQAEAEHLVEHVLPRFKLVILTEAFDQGLMVLRHLLDWEMIDMTYTVMYETKEGSKRFDGKPLVNKPRFEDLPRNVQDRIDEITKLDCILYNASVKEYEKRRNAIGRQVMSDLVEFETLQSVVTTYLSNNASSKANVMYHSADVYSSSPQMYAF